MFLWFCFGCFIVHAVCLEIEMHGIRDDLRSHSDRIDILTDWALRKNEKDEVTENDGK